MNQSLIYNLLVKYRFCETFWKITWKIKDRKLDSKEDFKEDFEYLYVHMYAYDFVLLRAKHAKKVNEMDSLCFYKYHLS